MTTYNFKQPAETKLESDAKTIRNSYIQIFNVLSREIESRTKIVFARPNPQEMLDELGTDAGAFLELLNDFVSAISTVLTKCSDTERLAQI